MRSTIIVAALCLVHLSAFSAVAQNCSQQSVRHRLIFRLFRRVCPPRVVAPPTCCPTATSPVTHTDMHVSVAVPMETNVVTSDTTVAEASDADHAPDADTDGWRSLFDGKQLGEWSKTKFGGEGSVDVEDGQIKLDYGQYMTGVTHSGKGLPENNYEIELEAMRVEGSDFFCGLTFPVDDKFASFVCGGWGGSVCGISSIDGMDASENTTTAYKTFKNGQWYKVRVRVTKERLQAWVDDELFVDEEVSSDRLSTRIEMDRCQPMGIASFDTQAAIRNVRVRDVDGPQEAKTESASE